MVDAANAVATQDVSLEVIVDEMFNGTRTTFTLKDGTVVTFRTAKFKQLASITRMFNEFLTRIPKDKFRQLLELIVESQVKAMATAKGAVQVEELQGFAIDALEKSLGQNSLLLGLFSGVLDLLPNLIPQFSDINPKKLDDLEIEEGIMLCVGCVAANYAFFTQTLPQLLRNVMGGWSKSKGSASTAPAPSDAPTTSTAGQ